MAPQTLIHARSHPIPVETSRHASLSIRLRDGRTLCFTEYGAARGYPLFYLHDSGSSRIEAMFFDSEARRKGFRLVSVDRPGVGGSDPLPGFTREDCADDLLQLADHLRCKSFALLGVGSGSAIALVTANRAPERVGLVLGISSQLPVCTSLSSSTCGAIQSVLRLLLQCAIGLRLYIHGTSADKYLERLSETLSYADRRLLDNPVIREQLALVAEEAVRTGGAGVARDVVLGLAPMPLASHQLQMPIHLWQGSAETSTSHQVQREFSDSLPECRLHILNNRGRYFYWRYTEEIFVVAHNVLSGSRERTLPTSTKPENLANTGSVEAVAMAG